jgi:hypothetical protein
MTFDAWSVVPSSPDVPNLVITHKFERRLFDTVSFHRRAHPVPQPSKAGLRWESGSTGLCGER